MQQSSIHPHHLQKLQEAERLRLSGHLADAESMFCDVLEQQADCDPAQHALALIAAAAGQLPAAIDSLVKAIAMRPEVAAYHSDLGELCRRIGRFDDAIRALREALRYAPDDANYLYNLGLALLGAGRFNDATAAFSAVMERNVNHRQAMANLGALYLRQGERNKALAYQQALESQAYGLAAHLGLAVPPLVADIVPPAVQMRDTNSPRGRGMFAQKKYREGDLVEVAPVVLLAGAFESYPEELKTYVFNWAALCGGGHSHAMALGYASLYNHDNPANLHYEADPVNMAMRFYAARDIGFDEELTINYSGAGGRATSENNDWFDRLHKPK